MRSQRYIDAFVDAELEPQLVRRIETHIERCTRCAHVAEVTIALKSRLGLRRERR